METPVNMKITISTIRNLNAGVKTVRLTFAKTATV